ARVHVPQRTKKSGHHHYRAFSLSTSMTPKVAGAITAPTYNRSFRRMATQQKKMAQRAGFKTGEFIVYPAHGVGQIVNIESQEVAGHSLELFVIDFQKDKMRLKVPVAKATSSGMRKLSEED